MVNTVGAGLLVLDTRARCTLGLEENSATEQGLAVDSADSIRAAAACTVWGIHHTGRNGSNPRGSTAWDGAVWSDLRLTSESGTAQMRRRGAQGRGQRQDLRLPPDPAHRVRREDAGAVGGGAKVPGRFSHFGWEFGRNSHGGLGKSWETVWEFLAASKG